ncbi:MAG: hypothetical protein ABIY55_25695, partial [Kofleriaceae bacterium]
TTGSGRAPDTDRAPDASRVTPAASPGAGGSTAVTIHFTDEPTELKSPTHELAGTRRDATLSDPHSDHDLVVRWRAPAASAGWVEREGDGGFAAVVLEAPAAGARKPQLRVSLAIDRAATTRGDGDVVERPLVRALLGALDRPDRVRLLGGDAAWSAPADLLAAIDRSWATPPAAFDLTRVLAAARPEGAAILLISDGLVADDAAAIAAARRLGVPVHVLGIGSAPARATLQQIAAVTGGTVRYAIAGDDLAVLATAVLADLATPPAPLAINWGTLGATDVEPAVLPRLGAGQAMLIVARIRRAQAAIARTRGELFAFEALAPARAVDGAITTHGPLARRWARERLGDLLASPHDRTAIASLAISYGLVSPYTSLVAIGSEVVLQGGVKHSVAVPVSLPAGMQWHAVKQAMEVDALDEALTDATPVARPPAPRPSDAPTAKRPAPQPSEPPATKPAAPPAPSPEAKKKQLEDDAGDAAGEDDSNAATRKPRAHADGDDRSQAKESPKQDAGAGAAPDLTDAELAKLAEQEAKEEVITVTGSTIERKAVNSPAPVSVIGRGELISLEGGTIGSEAYGRPLRLTVALGGGLVVDHGTRGLAALAARIERNRRTALGVEAALWLIDGSATEGRALLTVARRGIARWLELGLGAGVQFGDGTGVAATLRLRIDTPVRGLGGYLRYDAAALLTRPSLEAEHVFTLGLELSY